MNRPIFVLCLIAAAAALAEEAPAPSPVPPATPTADEARKVIRYYYEGKETGPLLVQLKACSKIDTAKDSKTKNECLEEVSGPVKKGSNVHAWTLWMVPDGGEYEDLAIQYVHEGQVRTTLDLKLTTSLRSRTFRASTLAKAGKWEIKVLRRDQVLATVPVTVE